MVEETIEGIIKDQEPDYGPEPKKDKWSKRHRPESRKRPPADYGKRRRHRAKIAKASKRRNRMQRKVKK